LWYKIDILSMPGHDVINAEIAHGPHGTICEPIRSKDEILSS
jgi:hypothetical protein